MAKERGPGRAHKVDRQAGAPDDVAELAQLPPDARLDRVVAMIARLIGRQMAREAFARRDQDSDASDDSR